MAYLDSFPNSFDTDRIKINWDRFTDAAEASTNFERMINLDYEGDTAKYLTDLLQLNDVVGYCGLPFRTHVARKLPKQIIRLVYSAGGNVPEDDDEFVKAIATAGRLYEKMLANPGTGYTAKAKAYKQKNFTQDKHHRNQHSQDGEGRPMSLAFKLGTREVELRRHG
ncbi:hypothetical protein E4U13_003291 [Claviceps humidiphila]|uniref:Uncharacterized protein n=1 Tax=Claviceps humidiphila TaxID=1294629 RepID=A0A9P7PYM9_9HYPO|nr:hypothetical protein E4U13_003291 [Claviceps humidiphila]